MEAGGYYTDFYTSASVAQNIVSRYLRDRYAFWCAQWASANSLASTSGLWQYSSKGRVSGINGNVDMNYGYVDYPSIINKGGFNGYGKGSTTATKSIDTLAGEVLDGAWGNGQTVKTDSPKPATTTMPYRHA